MDNGEMDIIPSKSQKNNTDNEKKQYQNIDQNEPQISTACNYSKHYYTL